MELDVYNKTGEKVETLTIDEAKLGDTVNHIVLKQVVVAHEANQRQGNANTLSRRDLTYSSKKAFKQKGTGNARQGRKGAPHHRSGAVAMGPKTRDFSVVIPQKMKKAAVRSALLSKVQDQQIKVLTAFDFSSAKTKDAVSVLTALQASKRVLVVTDEYNENVVKSFRNIPRVAVRTSAELNAYDLLNNEVTIFSKEGITKTVERVAK